MELAEIDAVSVDSTFGGPSRKTALSCRLLADPLRMQHPGVNFSALKPDPIRQNLKSEVEFSVGRGDK